jgi:hypothetical protein
VHVVLAGERVRPEYVLPAPEVTESEPAGAFRVLKLEPLVRMKLTSYRDRDRTHIRDLLEVRLIDASWCARLPEVLQARLKEIIDTPHG